MGFARHLDVNAAAPAWRIPISEAAGTFARKHIPNPEKTLLISPCSSHALRDWHTEGYAHVIDYANHQHGLECVLIGGRSEREQSVAQAITELCRTPVKNLVGKDTLPQLTALLARARLLLTPDSGPAHIANAVGTDVLGLYAATDPGRSGPYHSRQWCVDRYADAAALAGLAPGARPRWGRKFELPGVMDLITQGDVCATLDRYMACVPKV